jgi:dTDP-4-dehydrorhamnose reductase
MKFLITGANGMLGKDLCKLLSERGHEVVATDRAQLDITDKDAVFLYIEKESPDVVINTAAYNFVDKIEEDDIYPIALAINGSGPGFLAEAAKEHGAKFVHYSTDYVFSGEKPEGYSEEDEPAPISKYGETKLAGEHAVKDAGGEYYICRVSKLFGEPGHSEGSKESFVSLMLRLAEKLPELNIVDEEVGCPTYTPDLAKATLSLLEGDYEPGVYHLINDDPGNTWYEFAQEIFEIVGVNTPRNPVPSSEFPKPAKRPKFAALLNTKFPKLRSRREALKDFLSSKG